MEAMIEARAFVHRISRDEYYRMAEAGILDPGRRYELLDGQIIDVSPQNAPPPWPSSA